MSFLIVLINIVLVVVLQSDLYKAEKDIQFNTGITAIGTKWCGPSNTASNSSELGVFDDVDKCCRAHDYCDEIIKPGKSLHGLQNKSSMWPKLECGCDARFYNCLEKISGFRAWSIKKIYFTVQRKCFKYDYPIKKCVRDKGIFQITCTQYELDLTKPKKWQWFDNP